MALILMTLDPPDAPRLTQSRNYTPLWLNRSHYLVICYVRCFEQDAFKRQQQQIKPPVISQKTSSRYCCLMIDFRAAFGHQNQAQYAKILIMCDVF